MLDLVARPFVAARELVDGGGPFVLWIYLCGVVLWTLVLERTWYFRRVLPDRSKEMLERWNGPSSALATALKAALLQRDVYVFCRWNMLFVAPPLPVTDEELAIGVHAIDEALDIADRYAATGKI